MKPSLWDLKHFTDRHGRLISLDHEAIPMGFETIPGFTIWEKRLGS